MELPLFPLRTVLFPGMELPLQIFEDRYKAMTRELLENGGRFGVILIREGREVGGGAIPFGTGTTAYIEESRELKEGRFVLTARGERRFRLIRMLPPRPYPYGEIELIDDDHWEASAALDEALAAVRLRFPEYFQLALSQSGQWARGLRLPAHPHRLVDFLAPWLQADEPAKQRLLELEPAAERVEYLAGLVDDLLTRTRIEVREQRCQRYNGIGSNN
ncbi:MAG: LON peptidase substrate-binding domain-containing protein [Chloroflexi bacterium]|nr:LON peptidase substrate-binding domain-containing protein [Chloroflexota bacterium]